MEGVIPVTTYYSRTSSRAIALPDEIFLNEARHGKAFKGLLERYFGK